MALCTNLDEQIDKYCEVVSINKSTSQQNFYLKFLNLIVFYFKFFVNIEKLIF